MEAITPMAPFKYPSVVVKVGTILIGLYTLYTILPTNQISTVFPHSSEVNKTRPPYKVVKLHKSDLLWSNHDILSVDEWMRTMEKKHQNIKSNIAKACQEKREDFAKSSEKIIDIFNQVKTL